jgi:hypothetical protein
MGNGDPRNAAWNTWQTAGDVDPWAYSWYGLLARGPEFRQSWIDRWQSLRRTQFSAKNLGELADSLAAQVTPEAAARDAARWIDNQSRYVGVFLGEVAHMKAWLTQRAACIDEQFVAVPIAVPGSGDLTFTPPPGAKLAYTLDGSDPRSLGAAVAPCASLTFLPLVVRADANIHVRAYRTDRVNTFPGTP